MHAYPIAGGIFTEVGRNNVDVLATGCGPDGPEIKNPVEARISAPVQNGPGAHAGSCAMGTGSFPGVKRPGRGVDHSPPSGV